MLVVLLAGCEPDRPTPVEVSPDVAAPARSLVSHAPVPTWDLDAEWARLARDEIPGFAGYFRDESGDFVVSTARPDFADQAASRVRSILASEGRSEVRTRTRLVTYAWDELIPWRDKLIPLLDGEEVIWLDMDEVQNMLVFGVTASSAALRILDRAAELGIPSDAVSTAETSRPVQAGAPACDPVATSIDGCVRPVLGGLQIEFQYPPHGQFPCTLGFNAFRGSISGFLTASHCSTTWFGLDGTPQYQHMWNPHDTARRIGSEHVDPPAYLVGSPSLYGRPSDAAFYRYDPGVPTSFGHIARTLFPGVNQNGSWEIDPVHPEFRITGKAPNSVQVVNELVNKVGRSSGWTKGQVTQTCVWVSPSSGFHPTYWLPCQWKAALFGRTGDSGSAVFQQVGPLEPAASEVRIWGVLNSVNVSLGTSWYSPISAVEGDLGLLNVACDPFPAPCHPPVFFGLAGPHFIPQTGDYQWWAEDLQGGDGSYTFTWFHRIHHQEPLCDFQTGWQQVGTSPTLQQSVLVPGYNFELRLDVTSGGRYASQTLLVFPASSPGCPF